MKVLGSVTRQKCKFCRRRGCNNCSENDLIKKAWIKQQAIKEFFSLMDEEIFHFTQKIETNNKYHNYKFMSIFSLEKIDSPKPEFEIFDIDHWDLEHLFDSYKIDEYLKNKYSRLDKMVEIPGSISEQKCKFCLKKGCTKCSKEYEIKLEFEDFLHDEVKNFVGRVERRNKFGYCRYMGSNHKIKGRHAYVTIWGLNDDPDLFDLDALLHNYELYKPYKTRSL